MSCFPGGHAASLGMTHSLHHTSSSLLHQGSFIHLSFATPAASSLPLLLSPHPLLPFLILPFLPELPRYLSHPPTPPPPHFLFLFLCSHHHPLSPSRLACKLPFPLLSQLLLLLPSLSSSYSLSGQCHVISSFQAGNWLWKTARTWLNAPSAPQPTTHIHTST